MSSPDWQSVGVCETSDSGRQACYQRYEDDFADLAAAVRGERALDVSLDDELLVAETVLQASDMLLPRCVDG
jgi:hypothetical protein